MEQLLFVTTTQTDELIASFQNRFNKLKSDHGNSLHKLLCNSKSQRQYNQTSIDRLTKIRDKQNNQISQLESEYRVSLTHIENQHNKKISSMRAKAIANQKTSKRKYAQVQSKCKSYAQKYACMESKCILTARISTSTEKVFRKSSRYLSWIK